MHVQKTKVLLVLPVDVLERARVLAGRATTDLRLAVSVQIVLRALIEAGLKQGQSPALRANLERQATAVRDIRRAVHRRARADRPDAVARRASSRRSPSRRRR